MAGSSDDHGLVAARSGAPVEAAGVTLIAVADALAYAHRERVIHRDLKPANVLVGDFGETVVIDWGLAKDLAATETPEVPLAAPGLSFAAPGDSGGETAYGAVIGTPAYMPPEQARGEPVDERADVYALGALAYHVLCGRAPVEGTSLDELLANVITKPVVAPRACDAQIPLDLDTIILKAMAPVAADRYPSAVELAADLRRFQTGQLVGAHHYTPWQLVARWIRRRRTVLAVVGAALAILVVGGVVAVNNVVVERDRAALTTRALLVEQGRREALDQHPLRALALLAEAMRLGERGGDLPYLLGRSVPLAETMQHRLTLRDASIDTVAFSADEQRILTGSTDGRVRVWDATSVAILANIDVQGGGNPIELGPSERFAVAHTTPDRRGDLTSTVWDLATGKPGAPVHSVFTLYDDTGTRVWRFGGDSTLEAAGRKVLITVAIEPHIIAARAHGPDALVITEHDMVRLHDDGASVTEVSRRAIDLAADAEDAAIDAQLDHVVTVNGGRLDLVSAATGELVGAYAGLTSGRVAIRDDGSQVTTAGEDQKLTLPWGPPNPLVPDPTHELVPCSGSPRALHYSGDGHRLIVECPDTQLLVYDADTSAIRATLSAELAVVGSAISRDGSHVLAALGDGSVAVWDTSGTRNLAQLPLAADDPSAAASDWTTGVCVAYDARDRLLVFASTSVGVEGRAARVAPLSDAYGCTLDARGECMVRLAAPAGSKVLQTYDLADPATPRTTIPITGGLGRFAVAAGGRRVVALTAQLEVTVYDDGKLAGTWPAPNGIADDDVFALATDGRRLLVTDMVNGRAEILDVTTGRARALPVPELSFAAWAASDDEIITGTRDGVVQLVRAADGVSLARFARPSRVRDAALAADGADLFVGTDDGVVRQWRVATGALVRQTQVAHDAVKQLRLDPRGERYATMGQAGDVSVWSIATGAQLQHLATFLPPVVNLAFSRGGDRLAVLAGGVARQYDTRVDGHTPEEVRELVARFVPFVIEDGHLAPKQRLE